MRAALLFLVLATALIAPAAAGAQGGAPAPDLSEPCSLDYPGDDASERRIARWMARGAADRGLPRELPVMVAIGESGIRNLPGPSFFGYFSMHRTLNAGDFRGFPRRPELQLRWFLDTAVAVRQRRVAGGLPDPARDEKEFGLWIADVERPAPENRSLYQQYLDDARALRLGVCAAPVAADTLAPAIRVRVPRRQRPVRSAGAVTARVRCPAEACLAGLTGSVSVSGRSRDFRAPAAEPPEDGAVTLSARLPRAARRALARRRTLRVTLRALAVDEAANAAIVERSVRALP